jgi:hypothetical protein
MPGGMGAAAAAAVAPSIATPILEESDASLGEPVDGNQDAHAEWVELVERIRSEKTGIMHLTKH